jgi:protein-disulfide isomerase
LSLTSSTSSTSNTTATVGRLLLAGVFGYAALTKIGDPAATVRSVRAYQILPDQLAVLLGHALPAVELTLAVLLVLGVALRLTAAVASALLVMFLVGIVSADARGLMIDCGCFGSGGATTTPSYTSDIVRDLGMLAVAVAVVVVGRSRLALTPRLPEPPEPTDPNASGAARRRARTASYRYETAVTRHGTLTRRTAIASAGALVLSGLLGVAVASATAPAPPTMVPAAVTSSGGIVVGSATARHTVIAYEDPQCPICGEFEKGIGSVLAAAVKAGTVRVEYRMRSFLGPESVRAVAALGAAQDGGKFEALREQLFAHQPPERTGGFTVSDLITLGRDVGLGDTYAAKVRSQTYAAWAKQVDDTASRDGNTGTPQLILDGRALSNTVVFDATALQAALA